MTNLKDFLHRVATAQERIAAAYEDLAETMHELPTVLNSGQVNLPVEVENFKPSETKVVQPEETKKTRKPRRTKEQIAADKAAKEAAKTITEKVETEDEGGITQEHIRSALIAFVKKGGKTAKIAATEIIASDGGGAEMISDIPEENYQAVLNALEIAKAEIEKAA